MTQITPCCLQHYGLTWTCLGSSAWRNIQNYTTWKAGCPGVEVGLAMTFVSMSCREFDSGRLTLDIADMVAIRYPASRVDDIDDSDESTGEVVEDDNDEDDRLCFGTTQWWN